MDLHGNAALSWSGRRELAGRVVDQGWTLTAAAEAAGVSVRCARKWVGRYRDGDRQLLDRSSAPRSVANRTDPERLAVIAKLRRLRMTAAEIAETLAMPLSTVSGILTRIGMGRLGRLGLEQPVRYERARPGELVHVDVKKLGRSRAAPASASAMVSANTSGAAAPTPPAYAATESAGSTSTSPSTTTAASPTPKSSPTRKPIRPPPSCDAPSPSTAATAPESSAS
jgi:transposase